MTQFSDPPAWVADAIFYQIFPDRFASSERAEKPGLFEPWDSPPTTYGFKGGDLLGIVDRLDYIQGLGVTALYLTPVFSSASNHRYHTYDYYQVDPLLGGDDALRELLDACHARGMRVVLDGVFNHSGRGFWPFHHIVETGGSSPYVDWFYTNKAALAAGKQLRPYPSQQDEREMAQAARRGDVTFNVLGYRAWWDLPALPKLNTNNPQMREHLMRAVEHWLHFGIDGWRLDVAEEIDAGFWREFRQRARAINEDAYIVAEIWREKPEWVSGDTFDATMNYPLTEALLSFTAGQRLDMGLVSRQHEYREFVRPIDGPTFGGVLEHLVSMYRPQTIKAQLNLLGSHDTPRFLSLARGDRQALRLATLAVMTLPGAPCIYYGDEIGMEGREDPDNRRAFPWDKSRWDQDVLGLVTAATALRSRHEFLRTGPFYPLAATGHAVAYGRGGGNDGAIVVLNASDDAARLTVGGSFGSLSPVELPGWTPPRTERSTDGVAIEIGPRSGAFIRTGGAK